ncbi:MULTISPECIES: FecR family protein [Acinetobacter]|uniref:FecR family protein n=1 Tax=Acinetobacter TaxID=469 RepID=UPI00019AE435|nr:MULTISPECIES: FecR domain-containing protein [Acinetobacter]EEH67656.1 sigma factor regulatory protein, FecR/PupR family [Acinetobacter sp. ATCC 27244]NAR52041.1 iron ABC transporter permease [Acinetobacter haemolyticus]NAR53920.1 iron ABC transporter permease [Acinetobacter haemolyticus]NAR58119.1 iron ABC transporter permease [Acinetobacter haemolyticus]NAR61756.1 iron ABC transporter permease [Acinetobacter haemolyticus]
MTKNHNQQLVEEAAQWIVQLSADDEVTRRNAEVQFKQWKKNSQQHQKIANDIERCLGSIQKLSHNHHKKITKSALKAGLGSGKVYKNIRTGTAFAIALCTLGIGTLYLSDTSLGYIAADIRSNSSQWTTQTLQDGSQIILRGKSAVNIDFKSDQRVVELVQGEIFIDVAKDQHRPFIVKTSHGQIQALGTAFSVAYQPEITALKMLHSKVQVRAKPSKTTPVNKVNQAIVEAGQTIGIDQNGLTPISVLNRYNEQQKWNKHQLMVEDLPLNQVLKALDQNYKGKIIFNDSALNKIQVNAVLPLDQTQDALKLLGAVFPQLKIYQITPYVIFVTT